MNKTEETKNILPAAVLR